MTEYDLLAFRELFDDLVATFGRRFGSEAERTRCVAQYFDVLRYFDLPDVRRGFDRLREGDGFPKGPSAWRAAIPSSGASRWPAMTDAEMRECDDVERRGYEGDVCVCRECREAGVTHQPLRYVPRLDASGELMKRRHLRNGAEKILGEYIHGERLRTWYTARADFYQAFADLKRVRTMPEALVPHPYDEGTLVTVGEAVRLDGREAKAKRQLLKDRNT